MHLGDRRGNNGRRTPFGEGEAPIIEVLRMIRDNRWPIVALLEFEHGTLRSAVEEVQRVLRARQRHHARLENFAAAQVAGLMAYLATR